MYGRSRHHLFLLLTAYLAAFFSLLTYGFVLAQAPDDDVLPKCEELLFGQYVLSHFLHNCWDATRESGFNGTNSPHYRFRGTIYSLIVEL